MRHNYLIPTKIFTLYIFSYISRRALNVRKFDVSKNYYHKRTNRVNWYVCKKKREYAS